MKFAGSVDEAELRKVAFTTEDGRVVTGTWSSRFGKTEWSFRPGNLSGAKKLTLTIPSDFCGTNGVATGEVYTASFSVDAEASASLSPEDGTADAVYAVTVPVLATGYDTCKLRLRVTNDAANTLALYLLSLPQPTRTAFFSAHRR